MNVSSTATKATLLRSFHAGSGMLILPNAWDAATARSFEAAGFAAIATTSGGVAAALGHADHEGAPAEEMLAAAARIIAAVEIPVTVDFEAGYGLEPAAIAEQLTAIGAAGFNFEDSDHRNGGLVDASFQAERIAAIKAAAAATGVDLVLNARVDVFIQRTGTEEEQAAEALRRARLYRQAGADSVYPILLRDEAIIADIVSAAGVVNINVRRDGPLSLRRATELGIRRVSYATSIFRETMAAVDGIALEIRTQADALTGRG